MRSYHLSGTRLCRWTSNLDVKEVKAGGYLLVERSEPAYFVSSLGCSS
jgi:hypothetical protein